VPEGTDGRPGRRCGYVQRRRTKSRCQRSRVSGRTKNPPRRVDGRSKRFTGRILEIDAALTSAGVIAPRASGWGGRYSSLSDDLGELKILRGAMKSEVKASLST